MMTQLLTWIYARLLTLYPAEFYSNFADEMQDTFAEHLEAASRMRWWVGLCEIVSLFWSIIGENRRFADRVNPVPIWQMAIMLFIPVVAAGSLLMLRSVHIFYLPGKTWWLLLGISLIYVFIGLLTKGRYLLLVLPLLGFMLSIGERLFWQGFYLSGYYIPNYILYFIPLIILIIVLAVLSHQRQDISYRWIGYIMILPLTAVITGILAVMNRNPLEVIPDSYVLLRQYFSGTLIPAGQLSVIFLIGLPLARRAGSKAVILMIGYFFSLMVGLSASVSTNLAQNLLGLVYLILFMGVVPLLYLSATTQRFEKARVMIPVILSYALLFGIQERINWSTDPVFMLYRTGEMVQTLVMLALAIEIYRPLQERRKNSAKRSPQASLKSDELSMVSS